MDRARLVEQFKSELRQAIKDYEDGRSISLEELDWGFPLHVAESRSEYHVDGMT